MIILRFVLLGFLVSMSMCCFGQDCEPTNMDLLKKPKKESACYEFVYIPDQYRTVTEPVTFSTPEERGKASYGCIPTNVRRELYKTAYCGWIEVICGDKSSPKLYVELKQALKSRGYDTVNLNPSKDKFLMKALRLFQQDNNLPVGYLSVEMIRALGIDYKQFGSEK